MEELTVLVDGCGPGPRQRPRWQTVLLGAAAVVVAMALVSIGRTSVALSTSHRIAVTTAPQVASAAALDRTPSLDGSALDEGAAAPLGRAAVVAGADDRRVQAALAAISYPWQEQLPGWQLVFLGADSAYFGMTLVDEHRIEIYVRDDQSPAEIAGVIAHELGHAVDVTLLCWSDRYDWLVARGQAPTATWYVEDGASDFESGAGDFAEAFAVWQVGRESWSHLAGPLDTAQLDTVARLAHAGSPQQERC